MGSAAQCRLPTPPRGASASFSHSFTLVASRPTGPLPETTHTAGVDQHRAELSSANTTLDDLVGRVASAGERLLASGEESLAHDLFEVERSLRAAQRRLAGVVGRMRSG
jgi:hypothetical protein